MGLWPRPLVWMRTHYLLQNIRTGRNVVRVHPFELLGSSEQKWGVAGVWKIYPVELQERARLHFPYASSTYYHVESVLQKRLKRQDHPLLIVSISFYNTAYPTHKRSQDRAAYPTHFRVVNAQFSKSILNMRTYLSQVHYPTRTTYLCEWRKSENKNKMARNFC